MGLPLIVVMLAQYNILNDFMRKRKRMIFTDDGEL